MGSFPFTLTVQTQVLCAVFLFLLGITHQVTIPQEPQTYHYDDTIQETEVSEDVSSDFGTPQPVRKSTACLDSSKSQIPSMCSKSSLLRCARSVGQSHLSSETMPRAQAGGAWLGS